MVFQVIRVIFVAFQRFLTATAQRSFDKLRTSPQRFRSVGTLSVFPRFPQRLRLSRILPHGINSTAFTAQNQHPHPRFLSPGFPPCSSPCSFLSFLAPRLLFSSLPVSPLFFSLFFLCISSILVSSHPRSCILLFHY